MRGKTQSEKAVRSRKPASKRPRKTELSREQSAVPSGHEIAWADVIPPDQWVTYRAALRAAREESLPCLLGGGFGLAAYTGRWRNTKDMDFYVLPKDRHRMIGALTEAGFSDYYNTLPYDRGWLYRSTRDGIIVDVIWSMANRRAEVDPSWFVPAPTISIHDQVLHVVPAEELFWCKIYVFQRDHCDWTDAINLIYAVAPQFDWDRLIRLLGDDLPILRAVLTLFDWLTPSRAAQLPQTLRSRLDLRPGKPISRTEEERRISMLDSRAWFAAHQPKDRVLEV
jgi:hypothetical protein